MAISRRKPLDLFNFSFLDVLACTIGLLIFILTLLVVSAGGIPQTRGQAGLKAAKQMVALAQESLDEAKAAELRYSAMLQARSKISMLGAGANSQLTEEMAWYIAQAKLLERTARLAAASAARVNANTQASVQKSLRKNAASFVKQLADLKAKIAAEQAQTRQMQKQKHYKHVVFHIPIVHKSFRISVWVEVAGDNMWTYNRTNYHEHKDLLDAGTTYIRRRGAIATSAKAFLAGTAALGGVSNADPETTVLSFVVRPNAFPVARKLEEWARKQGFAVDWYPMPDEDNLTLVRGTPSAQ